MISRCLEWMHKSNYARHGWPAVTWDDLRTLYFLCHGRRLTCWESQIIMISFKEIFVCLFLCLSFCCIPTVTLSDLLGRICNRRRIYQLATRKTKLRRIHKHHLFYMFVSEIRLSFQWWPHLTWWGSLQSKTYLLPSTRR